MMSRLTPPNPPRQTDRRGPYALLSSRLQLLHCMFFARYVASCGGYADESTSRLTTTTTTPQMNRQKVPVSVGRATKAGIEQRWVGHEQGRTEGRVSEDGTKKTPSDCGWLFQSLAASRPSDPTHRAFPRDLSGGFSSGDTGAAFIEPTTMSKWEPPLGCPRRDLAATSERPPPK